MRAEPSELGAREAVALASIYRDQESLRFEDLLERGDEAGIEALFAGK